MENFNDIKSLWQTDRNIELPQIEKIKGVLSQFNQKRKQKNLFSVILLVCCLIMLLLLVCFATIKMWTTYFGIMLWVGIAFYSIYLKIRQQNKLSGLETLSNNDFLVALEKEETQTCVGKSKNQARLFIAWAIGFFLYIYEPASKNPHSLLIGYGSLIVFIIAVWFFYIPFMTKRYQKNIQKTITHINNLKSQIHENN